MNFFKKLPVDAFHFLHFLPFIDDDGAIGSFTELTGLMFDSLFLLI